MASVYRDAELTAAPTRAVFVCQSKTDADAVIAAGFVATYAPTWSNGVAGALWDRKIVAIAPNDDAGRAFALACQESLAANAKPFRYLLLDDIPDGRSVADWVRLMLEAGPDAVTKALTAMAKPLLEGEQEPLQAPQQDEQEPPATYERHHAVNGSAEGWVQPNGAHNAETGAEWPEPLDLFRNTPVPPLRAEHLPPSLYDFICQHSDSIGADPAMLTISALVSCAACIHDGIKIQPKRHDSLWTESARLWGALVGDPSIRKSPSAKRATSHLWAIDKRMREQTSAQTMEWQRTCKDMKRAKDDSEPPPKPANHRLMAVDVTIESTSALLADNDRGMIAIHRELAAWFGQMDCYRQGATGKDQAYWLQYYDGGPMVIDRVGRPPVFVPNASMCLLGEIQPSRMRAIAKNMPDDGLLQRFMIVCAKRFNGPTPDRETDMQSLIGFNSLLDELFKLLPTDLRVRICDDGIDMRNTFEADMLALAGADLLPERMRTALGKWAGLWPRLALTYHCIECVGLNKHPSNRLVTIETCTRVDGFLRHFLLGHTYAFYTDILSGSAQHEYVKWIAGYLLANKTEQTNSRDIHSNYKAWRTAPDWLRGLAWRSLEDAGWLSPVYSPANRAKVTHWNVNPRVHEAFKDLATKEETRREAVRGHIRAGLGFVAEMDSKGPQEGDDE